MTRSQTVLNVIAKKNTSYLPSQITFSHRDKKMEMAERLGLDEDGVDSYLGNHYRFTAHLDEIVNVDKNDPYRMGIARDHNRVLPDSENPHMVYDLWGMKFDLSDGGYFNYANPLAGCIDEDEILETFHAPPLENLDILFSVAEEDLKKYGDEYLVVVSGYTGIWERSWNLVGIEEFMCMLSEDPERACKIMDIITEYKMIMAEQVVKRGFPIGHYGDDLGTQISTFFSEDMFVRYLLPRIRKIFRVFKDGGIPVQMHSCGKITPFIPHLIDAGLDVLEPVQACMDFEFLKREYGKDLTFYGGVDTQDLLTFRSAEDVYEGTMRTIDILGRNGGLIIGPSQEIMNNVPVENVLAMMRAIKRAKGEA
ncbi:hypothetical protein MCG98_13085 [Ruminococcus sp. OA3]|uniref:uroporphyrinogen decarboxylase family protein n=1 Tax=Ruminococcus sp. OA3 TaxID=2914164 RepID=UPI001F062D7A|nr:uroporphyrinogen decarboxylase family protein [Ruminococcus sp. OA3]MCH1983500.1 hypothetical protein [Ruminococcus sp. OA3]